MKSNEGRLYKWKVVYKPIYERVSTLTPRYQIKDITEFIETVWTFIRCMTEKYSSRSPMFIPLRTTEWTCDGLIIKWENVKKKGKTDIELMSVRYDITEEDANPYALVVGDSRSLRENFNECYEIFKALVGHWYYTGKQLEQSKYYLDDSRKDEDGGWDMESVRIYLKDKRDIARTKYDLLNEYLKINIEPGRAYNRTEQAKMVRLFYRRFDMYGSEYDEKKVMARPFYYVDKALKYTDYKILPIDHNMYKKMSSYYGMRIIVPREPEEKLDYFDDMKEKIRKALYGKE